MFLFVSVCMCAYVGTCLRKTKEELDLLELELKEVVNYLTCVIETKLRFPERTILALNL